MKALRLVAMATFVLLCGCEQHLSLQPLTSGVVRATEYPSGMAHQIPTDSPCYVAVLAWINENRDGWEQYLATEPSKGIVLDFEGGSIQFVDGAAIAETPSGLLMKSAPEEMYSCLTAVPGTGT